MCLPHRFKTYHPLHPITTTWRVLEARAREHTATNGPNQEHLLTLPTRQHEEATRTIQLEPIQRLLIKDQRRIPGQSRHL